MIYLDNAATTKMKPEVLETMLPFFVEQYYNPSAMYDPATKVKMAISDARASVAKLIGAKESEIFFTSGGSESDNWALHGVLDAYADRGKHIITSKVEHPAILQTCAYLETCGYEVTYIDVDVHGLLDLQQLQMALRPDTVLVSVMTANNEVGTIQPITEIAAMAHAAGALFHTDAVQAFGQIPLNVEDMGIDLLSASGHKLYGPKGIGVLYVSNRVKMHAFIHGGEQERNRRAGTENVPAIVGLGQACALAMEHMETRMTKESALRDYFLEQLTTRIPHAYVNGFGIGSEQRLPNNVNVSFPCAEGESILIMLDMKGICASSGSACTTGSIEPSHVLTAMGREELWARGSIRFTLSDETTREEVDTTVDAMVGIVNRLREMSPVYEHYVEQGLLA